MSSGCAPSYQGDGSSLVQPDVVSDRLGISHVSWGKEKVPLKLLIVTWYMYLTQRATLDFPRDSSERATESASYTTRRTLTERASQRVIKGNVGS